MKPEWSCLKDVKNIDASQLLPGPHATSLLLQLGADVIKVERRGSGDPSRELGRAVFAQFNRDKRSVALDLRDSTDRDAFLELVRGCDAVVGGFRPGVMKSFGLGYDDLVKVNPAIVMCSISGFGQTGPYADNAGHDLNYLAMAGYWAAPVQVIAPEGFYEHAISENVLTGPAMTRRAQYMYGSLLPRSERGQVDTGLGKGVPANPTVSLIAPTLMITRTLETRRIDGVDIEFQLTPGTEAPAEMNLYFPQFKTLCVAENATRVQHNVLTLRGALVRDPKVWAHYLDDALVRYGDKAEVLFAQHHWPTWGGTAIREYLADQRDMYAFLDSQTLRLINQGLTSTEIAAQLISLPPRLANKWYTRDYYGSLSHNVRAVYQRYMGFYDGNPANLNPLPPQEAGTRYVEAMGGADRVLVQARKAFDQGDYRWVAQLTNHLVFAQPDNTAARELQADALEQLGYQSENATWRNAYLTGAQELRQGVAAPSGGGTDVTDMVRALTPAMFFDYLSVRVDAQKAADNDLTINWRFTDLNEDYALTLRNGVLTHRDLNRHAKADVNVSMSKATLDRIALKQTGFLKEAMVGDIDIEGARIRFLRFMGGLDEADSRFNIVTP